MAGRAVPAASEASAVADADRTQNGQPPDDEDAYEDDEIVTVESTGKTVEEAIQKALDELGLEEDEVEIEILSEGSKGVLGLGSEQARVRVTSLPYEDEEYDEDEEEDEEDADEEGEVAPPGNRRFEPEPIGRRAEPLERVRSVEPAAEPYAEMARRVLAELLERMEISAEVSLDSAEMDGDLPSVELSITGEYMGILIGRHGDTLAALQFLLGLLVGKEADRRVRVTVDVEGYRERRARVLSDMAMRAADRAQRYRQPIFLEPMIPSERRIVHLTLADHPAVTTNSIGEGDARRVVVSPKNR
jgi:spoIIIJ-associated protein